MNQQATPSRDDQKKRLALILVSVVAVLIGISIWLAGRKGDKDKFSYDNLRKMIFGDDRG
jgi:hypothetical protein